MKLRLPEGKAPHRNRLMNKNAAEQHGANFIGPQTFCQNLNALPSPKSISDLLQAALELRPIEARARVGFTAWRDLRVPHDTLDRVTFFQHKDQTGKLLILGNLEFLGVAALQLNADGEVIAALLPVPARHPRMPGTEVRIDETDQ